MTRRSVLLATPAYALHQGDWEPAARLVEAKTSSGEVAAAVLAIQKGDTTYLRAFGKAKSADAIFLLASITKPMTVTALMYLADRSKIKLNDPVSRYIPEFTGEGREKVLVRHLLTHTSGLPDMLPENTSLRKRHAPLSEFVAGTCHVPLLFPPGKEVRYQSMGILLAAEIVSRIAQQPFPAFLDEHVFRPLVMTNTSLGLGGRTISETMQSQVVERSDWDWNSPYWRNLGAPWGGAHSNVVDLLKLLRYFAEPDQRVLRPETARSMVSEQTGGLHPRWGLGWALNEGKLGKANSPTTFGHSGSTGTLCWHDPSRKLSFVLLTTKPADESNKTLIDPVSDLVSALA